MVKVGSIRIHSKFSGCHFVLEMKKKINSNGDTSCWLKNFYGD